MCVKKIQWNPILWSLISKDILLNTSNYMSLRGIQNPLPLGVAAGVLVQSSPPTGAIFQDRASMTVGALLYLRFVDSNLA